MADTARKYRLVQFGLCAFSYDDKSNSYSNQAFNFYLWPATSEADTKSFSCQASSLSFLSRQGFDFNKLVKEGLDYMRPDQQEALKKKLKVKKEPCNPSNWEVKLVEDCYQVVCTEF